MKEIDENVWVNYLFKEIGNDKKCIIDDLRFENELESLIKNDWYFIVLNVDKNIRINRIKKVYPNNYEDHIKNMNDISEKSLDNFPKNRSLFLSNENIDEINLKLNIFLKKNL